MTVSASSASPARIVRCTRLAVQRTLAVRPPGEIDRTDLDDRDAPAAFALTQLPIYLHLQGAARQLDTNRHQPNPIVQCSTRELPLRKSQGPGIVSSAIFRTGSRTVRAQARDHQFGGRPDERSDRLLGHQMMKYFPTCQTGTWRFCSRRRSSSLFLIFNVPPGSLILIVTCPPACVPHKAQTVRGSLFIPAKRFRTRRQDGSSCCQLVDAVS